MLGVGITHANAAAFIGAVVLMVAGIGIMSPAGTALVVARYPRMAGTAASLLGTSRLALGGITAPLVGASGTTTALTLGMVMTVAAAVAFAASIAVTQASPCPRQHGGRSQQPVRPGLAERTRTVLRRRPASGSAQRLREVPPPAPPRLYRTSGLFHRLQPPKALTRFVT